MNMLNDCMECAVIVKFVMTLDFECVQNDIYCIQMLFLCFLDALNFQTAQPFQTECPNKSDRVVIRMTEILLQISQLAHILNALKFLN